MSGVAIHASLMCADQCALGAEVRILERIGIDGLHLDVMDAHFTPNLPLGLEAIRQLRGHTELPFDVHLMVEDNDLFLDLLAGIEVQRIAVHHEWPCTWTGSWNGSAPPAPRQAWR